MLLFHDASNQMFYSSPQQGKLFSEICVIFFHFFYFSALYFKVGRDNWNERDHNSTISCLLFIFQCAKIRQRVYGENHSKTKETLDFFASLYAEVGKEQYSGKDWDVEFWGFTVPSMWNFQNYYLTNVHDARHRYMGYKVLICLDFLHSLRFRDQMLHHTLFLVLDDWPAMTDELSLSVIFDYDH